MNGRGFRLLTCWIVVPTLTVVFLHLTGCSTDSPEYRENVLHAASVSQSDSVAEVTKVAEDAKREVETLLGGMDEPRWPAGVPFPVDFEQVKRAAGPVGRDHSRVERGLYRKHCVNCHGLTGDGAGPAASLLSPYPRDFRRGTFKFKSTSIGKKPTHEDIVRTIQVGLAGTSMPSFGSLIQTEAFEKDVDALAHYVRFLSIRGEVERRWIQSRADGESDGPTARSILVKVADNWQNANSSVVEPPVCTSDLDAQDQRESAERGQAIFQNELTACVKCHGLDAKGDGTSRDFDDWTKDWTIRAGINPESKTEWRTRKQLGALKPVVDPARNLHLGVLRGGSTRRDIAMRLILGIEGTPMPPVARKQNGNPGLTDAELCDLVEYVYSLSQPPSARPFATEASHARAN